MATCEVSYGVAVATGDELATLARMAVMRAGWVHAQSELSSPSLAA